MGPQARAAADYGCVDYSTLSLAGQGREPQDLTEASIASNTRRLSQTILGGPHAAPSRRRAGRRSGRAVRGPAAPPRGPRVRGRRARAGQPGHDVRVRRRAGRRHPAQPAGGRPGHVARHRRRRVPARHDDAGGRRRRPRPQRPSGRRGPHGAARDPAAARREGGRDAGVRDPPRRGGPGRGRGGRRGRRQQRHAGRRGLRRVRRRRARPVPVVRRGLRAAGRDVLAGAHGARDFRDTRLPVRADPQHVPDRDRRGDVAPGRLRRDDRRDPAGRLRRGVAALPGAGVRRAVGGAPVDREPHPVAAVPDDPLSTVVGRPGRVARGRGAHGALLDRLRDEARHGGRDRAGRGPARRAGQGVGVPPLRPTSGVRRSSGCRSSPGAAGCGGSRSRSGCTCRSRS